MRESAELIAARFEADRTRSRLMGPAQRLQNRLSPGTIASNAWQDAKGKGADLAENAVDAVRKRPVATTSVVAAIALFLAREPLMDLAGKAVSKAKQKLLKKAPAKARSRTRSTEKSE